MSVNNRDYFIFDKRTDDEDNAYSLRYYSNLVALDLKYLETNPIDAPRVNYDLSNHYNSLGWYLIMAKNFEQSLVRFKESLKYNPDNKYAKSNIPHVYLFTNQFEKAKTHYKKLKNDEFNGAGSKLAKFKDAFLADFVEFEDDEKGLIEPGSELQKQVEEIKNLLK